MLEKGIVVIPTHGFCNRLRMIASSRVFCDKYNISLNICWISAPECNINIEDFCRIDSINIIDLKDVQNYRYLYFGKVHTQDYLEKIKDIIENPTQNYQYIVIEGGHEFRDTTMSSLEFIYKKHTFYKSLVFTQSIQERVDEFLSNIDINNTIGVHYRDIIHAVDKNDIAMNNKLNFVKNSPLSLFIDIISKTKVKNVIVVSNTQTCYRLLKSNVIDKNVITTCPRNYSRNSREGIIDSIIDLLILSKMRMIVGSFYSSFSDEACFFEYIPKLIPLDSKHIGNDIKNNPVYHCHGFTFINYPIINDNTKTLFSIFGDSIKYIEDMY